MCLMETCLFLKKTPHISQKRYNSHIRWYFGWFWQILSQFFSEVVDRHVPEVSTTRLFTSTAHTTHIHCHSSWMDLTWEENRMNQFNPPRSWLAFLEKAVVCSTVDPCQTLKLHVCTLVESDGCPQEAGSEYGMCCTLTGVISISSGREAMRPPNGPHRWSTITGAMGGATRWIWCNGRGQLRRMFKWKETAKEV